MIKRIAAIVVVYLCITLAWIILGTTLHERTWSRDGKLKSQVGQLWGTVQQQSAPTFYYQTVTNTKVQTSDGKKTTTEIRPETHTFTLPIDASNLDVALKLDYRQKGLLWYSTYRVKFSGAYRVINLTQEVRAVFFAFPFPVKEAVYDNFRLAAGGRELQNIQMIDGSARGTIKLAPGQAENVEIAYESRGMDEWWYDFGADVRQIRNFALLVHTDFDEIDFPSNSISPTAKERESGGWKLQWNYSNLLSGIKPGISVPHRLNPGPWASRISFSAPISLFLFFFLLFILTTGRNIRVHPMNYFFIGAAFFSFHLLLAYLVDHISIHLAFLICSLVSIFLVTTYMRLVVGSRFAFVEVGILQFVYLVLFSYTFFFEGYTGLAITILCIATLFIVMQFTGRINWNSVFQKNRKLPEPAA